MAQLFDPLQLRDVLLANRIGIPPMCQYSAPDSLASDWHFVHYGSRAVGGAALMIIEATAVAPVGRISGFDLGLWDDQQIAPLSRIERFAAAHGCVAAIQLAHAGRKASVAAGGLGTRTLREDEGGWKLIAPSAVAFGDDYALPREMTLADIGDVIAQFVASARRARAAGFRLIELHGAHGYLLHQFLSPLANQRSDAYGGSFENRTRLIREVVTAVRAEWPANLPLFVRLSATDWVEGGWDIEQTVAVCRELRKLGVDLINVSTGGIIPTAKIPVGPGFQTEFAERIRRDAAIPTAAVGLITSPVQADHIVRSGQADLVRVGREILRSPYWPLAAAQALGQATPWPVQYLRAAPAGSVAR